MPTYEAMFIFKPDLKEDEQKALVEGLEKNLKESQCVIENSQPFGKRQFAYAIKKHREGIYYLVNFSTNESTAVSRLKHTCSLNESVLRVLVVKKKVKEAKR